LGSKDTRVVQQVGIWESDRDTGRKALK